jgi:hypothetical protein
MLKRTRNYGLVGGWLTPPTPTTVMTCPLCDGAGVMTMIAER